MLLVGHEGSLVPITVGVEVFAIALTLAVDVCAEVLIVIGVECVAEAGVVSGRVARLAAVWGELVRCASLFLCHLSFTIIIFELDKERGGRMAWRCV